MTNQLSSPRTLIVRAATYCCLIVALLGCQTTSEPAPERRSFGAMLDDQTIEIRVTDALHRDNGPGRGNHVKTISYNRTVLLVGSVRDTDTLEEVQSIVSSMDGIEKVINELQIAEPIGLATRSRDALLTAQVKSALLTTKGVDSTRFNLTSHRGVVYMMGLVTPEEGEAAARRAARVAGVKSVVKVLEYLPSTSTASEAN